MPKTIRRPQRLHPLIQVSVAVISGAAAMYVVLTFNRAALLLPAVELSAPGAPPETPKAPEAAVEPRADARFPVASKTLAPQPAPSSLLLTREPGGAPDSGIIGAYGDEPERPKPKPKAKQAVAPSAPQPAAAPVAKLQARRSMGRGFSTAVGHDFETAELKPRPFSKKAAPAPAPALEEIPAPSAPAAKTQPRLFEKAPLAEDALVYPSPRLHEETPWFWTPERKSKVVLAGLIALSGVGYLMFASGYVSPWLGRSRAEDESS